ncbi:MULTISPECIES: ATP-binding protein [Haloferacaceae]|uniref:ATP-binding protein n=1 Tax=Halorubrum glutamatedens TaxID=2707018 RepID=A0ABD5QNH7_9EURY|nr:ATP-binding protein [Halobellus captivus]
MLSPEDFVQHLLTVGQSGSGKTTLFYNMMDQVPVPFWSFDLKQDYRHLIHRDPSVLVLPWQEFRFNPLRPPPGVPPRRWAQVFSEIFGHATALLSGSKNYLMKQIIELYDLYDLFDAVTEPYPSLHDLQVLLEQAKINYVRKQADYRDTVHNRLEAMTLTAGAVFDCSQGHPIDDLLSRKVVFEFDGLGRDLQNFLMEILFAYVYEYRLAQNHRGGGLRHLFFLDEGKRVFSVYKERQDAAGIPAIDELTAKMREFGEGLVVADQEATKLTDSIKANTYTKILLPTGDEKQFQGMVQSMNLSERQADIARSFDTGEAVVQVGNRDPVPVDLTHVDVEKTIFDSLLRGLQAEIWSMLPYTPRQTTAAFRQTVGNESDKENEPTETDDPRDSGTDIDLSDEAVQLLKDVIDNPFTSLTDRYERFANDYKANQVKTELVDAELVRERTLTQGTEHHKLLELTDRGRSYVEDELDQDIEHRGRGGIIHRYWQHQIRDVFELAGWTAKVELFDADVYVYMDEKEIAVEVAMGTNDREIEHAKQRLDRGLDEVWVVCPNESVKNELKQQMEDEDLPMERIEFRRFRDFSDTEIFESS